MHYMFCGSVKQNSGTASMSTGSLWSEQNACFTRVTQVMARCQSQHQCHFWRINSMFEAYCTESELGSCQSTFWPCARDIGTYICICKNASYKIAHTDTGSKTSGNKLGLSNHLSLYSIGTASANSVESDLGSTSRIFFDYVTLTSQKPCQHNNKNIFINKITLSRDILLKNHKLHLFCSLNFSGNHKNGFEWG